MDEDRLTDAIAVFGCRVRGLEHPADDPGMSAWLRDLAAGDHQHVPPTTSDPAVIDRARHVARRAAHRLPPPARDRLARLRARLTRP